MSSPSPRGPSKKGGMGENKLFSSLCVSMLKRYEIRPKLLLMTNKKLHMRFASINLLQCIVDISTFNHYHKYVLLFFGCVLYKTKINRCICSHFLYSLNE